MNIDLPKKSLVYKLRNDGRVRGYLVAIPFDNTLPFITQIGIGFSLCNRKDRFDKKLGVKIAMMRAGKHCSTDWAKLHGKTAIPQALRDSGDRAGYWVKEIKIPNSLEKDLYLFIKRCQKYYGKKVGIPNPIEHVIQYPGWTDFILHKFEDNS